MAGFEVGAPLGGRLKGGPCFWKSKGVYGTMSHGATRGLDLLSSPKVTMDNLQCSLIIQLSLSHSKHLLEHRLHIRQDVWETVYALKQQLIIIFELDALHLLVGPGKLPERFLSRSPSMEIAQPLAQSSSYSEYLRLRRCRCCGCKMVQRICLQVQGIG